MKTKCIGGPIKQMVAAACVVGAVAALCSCGHVAEHEHDLAWRADGDAHWRVCVECDESTEAVEHMFADEICVECGYVSNYTEGLEYSVNATSFDKPASYKLTGDGGVKAEKIIIPSYVGGLPVDAVTGAVFFNNSSLAEVVVPDSVTTVSGNVFAGCYKLKNVKLSDNMTSIDNGLFYGCTGLKEFTVPKSVAKVERAAFDGCTDLAYIRVHSENKSFAERDGILYDKEFATIIFAPQSTRGRIVVPYGVTDISGAFGGCKNIESVVLPQSVKSIGAGAFRMCTSLINVALPDGLEHIGVNAFWGCSSLKNIELPSSVTEIWNAAFKRCSALTSIALPEALKVLGGGAFESCASLSDISLPAALRTIGTGAFVGCSGLTTMRVDEENGYFRSVDDCIIDIASGTVVAGCM